MKGVILSTSLILEEGTFRARRLTQAQAQAWVDSFTPENFCGHETVRILGLEPDRSRRQCDDYDQALCLKACSRLEFGREYAVEEIKEIGVEFMLITKQ